MIKGLSKAGLGNGCSDELLIELAGAYGFGAVDLIDASSLTERHGTDGARELLLRHGVKLGSVGLLVDWRGEEDVFRADLARLAQAAQAAAALGGTACCTYILPSTDRDAAHFMAVATRRLRACARVLDAYGIRLGLEYVGPHHLRTRWRNPFVWTLEQTLDWVGAIGEPNVGLLLDSYHWYTTGASAEELEQLRPGQIVHVHLNDAPDVPVEEALDNGRVYPGEGVIDLGVFLGTLQRIGYRGVVAQEILTQTPPEGTPEELAQRSQAGFERAYGTAGL